MFQKLTNNWGLKIVALVLATVSWYVISKITSVETWMRNVPIQVDVDDGWAVLDRSVNAVDVLFRGSQQDILSLKQEHTYVEVDMSGQTFQGATRVALLPRQVKTLGGARAIDLRPDEVVLRLDQEGEAQIPVRAEISSDPPLGYEVERVACTPASITVYGPRQRLMGIETVGTTPIDLKGRIRSFQLRAAVLSPSDRWVARLEPDTVTVDVTLVERSAKTTLEEVRVSAMVSADLSPTVRVFPGKVTLVLKGRSDLVEALQREDVRAFVDCTGLEASAEYDLPVRVDLPAGIRVSKTEPATVRVEMGEL